VVTSIVDALKQVYFQKVGRAGGWGRRPGAAWAAVPWRTGPGRAAGGGCGASGCRLQAGAQACSRRRRGWLQLGQPTSLQAAPQVPSACLCPGCQAAQQRTACCAPSGRRWPHALVLLLLLRPAPSCRCARWRRCSSLAPSSRPCCTTRTLRLSPRCCCWGSTAQASSAAVPPFLPRLPAVQRWLAPSWRRAAGGRAGMRWQRR
jgi:hypothetical protein